MQTVAALQRFRTFRYHAGGPGAADVRERRLAKFRQNVTRFRLYRLRFLQENNSKYAFDSIFQNLPDSQGEIFEI